MPCSAHSAVTVMVLPGGVPTPPGRSLATVLRAPVPRFPRHAPAWIQQFLDTTSLFRLLFLFQAGHQVLGISWRGNVFVPLGLYAGHGSARIIELVFLNASSSTDCHRGSLARQPGNALQNHLPESRRH